MQAVILAGGLGTRLAPLTQRVPKAMVEVAGKPFLEHELGLLRDAGIEEYVLCVGHMGEAVRSYFGDGSRWDVKIEYSFDGPKLLGAAGALKRAEPMLRDAFFVTYGDAYLRADYRALMERLLASGSLGVMAVYENRGRYGKSDLVVEGGRVVRYDKKSQVEGMDWINFGVTALRRRALAFVPEGTECGEEAFYGRLIEEGELLAFPVEERFYEIGTPASLREFEGFIAARGQP